MGALPFGAAGTLIMMSAWMALIVPLAAFVNGARNDGDTLPCAKVQTSSFVVPLGGSVSASCVIRDSCPLVSQQGGGVIEWQLDGYALPSSSSTREGERASRVLIPSFNLSRAFLTCNIQAQVVGGVEIRAGYPPESPQNLSCQTNLTTGTMSCRWEPGQREPLLPTSYVLHTENRDGNYSYDVPPGLNHYTVPRFGIILFSEMEIYVKAVNELGTATSLPITLEPVSAAKFDPPVIKKIQAKAHGCLTLSWSLSPQQAWMRTSSMDLELRVKTAGSSQWISKPTLFRPKEQRGPLDQCRLLHGTQYVVQVRVRYKESPWSEWSRSQPGVTLERAPSGYLEWWMKRSGDHVTKQVHLFWKASKWFRANSQNVSYVVSAQTQSGEREQLCSTRGNYCTFQLPAKPAKLYLNAVNRAGKSKPTKVHIHDPKVHTALSNVLVTPDDDGALTVQWRSMVSPDLKGFIVEWRPLLNANISVTQFEITDRNQTSLVLKGSFEPYKPYGISVYPRFKGWIGLPQTVHAYSRQKAPSVVPKMQSTKTWRSSIEFKWDEIPVEQRNGIIQSYKIFYWNKKGPVNVVTADLQERRLVLENLDSELVYEAFMMVSTYGGSLNGSRIYFQVDPYDVVTVISVTLSFGVALTAFIIIAIHFSSHIWVKVHFWPVVPDPANSSIKRWSSESTQDTHFTSENEEPNPEYISHLSFLDISQKSSKEDDNVWLSNAEDTSDLGESICGSPFIPQYSAPYATVAFGSPCNSPTMKTCPAYLRSESTQPLLTPEEPFTPQCYQNADNDGISEKQCFFGPCNDFVREEADTEIPWDDFPFLRALAMNQVQKE
ncbi:granulocyte colony-stimulating factor receptor isoform X1 [Takifugu flavidus]|nr:granulocyte colony-stimulating factor receptor isoform X1 [Takifugu flavidus]